MAGSLRIWQFDETTAHLAPVDLFLAEQLSDRLGGHRQNGAARLLEIGVWRGAWSLSLLRGHARVTGVGVDPFPGADQVRRDLHRDARDWQVATRFALVDTTDQVCRQLCAAESHTTFDLVHIDGEHTETAVTADLAFAAAHLSEHGVIVVDDYRFKWFPGVASAMYGFVADRQWAVFAATDNKAYLCRAPAHSRWLHTVGDVLSAADLPWSRGLGVSAHHPARYPEPPDIRGFGVALCLGPVPSERLLEGRPVPIRYRWTRSWRRWEPAVRETVRPMRHRLRRRWGR